MFLNSQLSSLSWINCHVETDCFSTIQGKSLETLSQSAEMAFKKYTEKDKSLCQELQENRVEQDKLQQRLNELKEHERKLEEERKSRSDTQQTAEMVRISIYSGPGP